MTNCLNSPILEFERLVLPDRTCYPGEPLDFEVRGPRKRPFHFLGLIRSPLGMTEKSSGRGWRDVHSKTAKSLTRFPYRSARALRFCRIVIFGLCTKFAAASIALAI